MLTGREDGLYGKYYKNKQGNMNFEAFGREVLVIARYEEIETGKQFLKLKFLVGDENKEMLIERGDLVKSSCKKFMNWGIDTDETKIDVLVNTIISQEEDIPVKKIHSGLGFGTVRGNKIFKLDTIVSQNSNPIESIYNGRLNISNNGSLEEWIKMANRFCVKHTPLAFIISTAIAAMLVGYFEDLSESMIIHLYNQSSKGKSTAAKLAASLFFNPKFDSNSLLTSWNNTENFSLALLDNNNGVLMVLDETSVLKTTDITNFLYVLTSGVEKGRLNSESEMKRVRKWHTVIMSTGELSLQEISNANDGLKVRVFNFGGVSWTIDAAHAEHIEKCINKNYGLPAKEVANYLVNTDYTTIKNEYEKCIDEYERSCKRKSHLNHRIAKKMGLILYGAKLAKKVLMLKIDVKNVLEFMIEHQDQEEELPLEEKAFEYIKAEVIKNRGRFIIEKVVKNSTARDKRKNEIIQQPNVKLLGKIWKDEIKSDQYIGFFPDELRQLLKMGGYKSPTTIMKKWKEKGLLDAEENRLTKVKTIRKGEKVRLITLIQKDYLCDINEKDNEIKETVITDKNKVRQQIIEDILNYEAC